MTAVLKTDIGKVRSQNEDCAYINEDKGIFAVADGMGGHLAGEVASAIAIESVRQMADHEIRPSIAAMERTLKLAHKQIVEHAATHPECSGMGTTLSCLWYAGKYVYIAHVGDSRVYRLRSGKLEQITQDHSLVAELVRNRLITKEEARTHPRRNIITRALGTQGDNAPDILAAECYAGDKWLLCTDGLNGMLEDAQIQKILNEHALKDAADNLLSAALQAGGQDNVTLILIEMEENGGNKANR